MNNEKIAQFNNRLKEFFVSDYYMLLLIVGAGIFIFTGQEILGVYIFSIFSALAFFLYKDITPVIQGIMVITSFAIKCKNSTADFVHLWPLSIPVFVLFFGRFFRFKPVLRKGGLTLGMTATSLAIVIGGAGIIYWKTYFSPTSLFYMFMLGFGMLLFYSFFNDVTHEDYGYDTGERLGKIMLSSVAVICISLVYEYVSRWDEFTSTMSVIPFQWRNNGATLLMLAMPFAFYFSVRKFGYFLVGLISYVAIVFTGSRGGLLFGAAELLLCIIVTAVTDKKHRKLIVGILCACAVIAGIGAKYILEILSYTIQRMTDPDENSIRLEMYRRGWEDFKASPIVGRGLAYMGNRDIHASAKHTLCWYHCSLIQVPASFGIIGIFAYIFLNVQRIRVYLRNKTPFNRTMLLSFIGLEMMSLVNPGIFAPFPYLFIVTLYFSMMENPYSRLDK